MVQVELNQNQVDSGLAHVQAKCPIALLCAVISWFSGSYVNGRAEKIYISVCCRFLSLAEDQEVIGPFDSPRILGRVEPCRSTCF